MELPDLAKAIGMSVSGLYTTIKSGKMKVETLEKIAEVLNVSMGVLFLGVIGDFSNKKEIQVLHDHIKELEYQLEEKRELISFYKDKIQTITTEYIRG